MSFFYGDSISKRLGAGHTRFLCGGFASTDRTTIYDKNISGKRRVTDDKKNWPIENLHYALSGAFLSGSEVGEPAPKGCEPRLTLRKPKHLKQCQ